MIQEQIHEFELVEIDDTGKQHSRDERIKRWSRRIVQVLVVCVVIYLFPTWKASSVPQNDGTRASVFSIWIGLISRAHGNPPAWQQWTMHDGQVLEGWLRDGLRDGWWNLYDNGLVIERIEYHRDREVARKNPQRENE